MSIVFESCRRIYYKFLDLFSDKHAHCPLVLVGLNRGLSVALVFGWSTFIESGHSVSSMRKVI